MQDTLRHLAFISIFSSVAHGAMREQYQRIITAHPPQLHDGYLFAVALADLLRAADEAEKALPDAEAQIRADKEALLPDARDFRNLLEHWPDYARGEGRDKERFARDHGLAPGKAWFWWEKLDPPTLRFGGSPGGLVLNVENAKCAGASLFLTVHDAVMNPMSFQRTPVATWPRKRRLK